MESLKHWTGTLLGVGLLPIAPGTWGSLASLPLVYFVIKTVPGWGIFLFAIITCLLSLWSSDSSVKRYGQDPGQFVMDEVAGQSVVFIFTIFTFSTTENMIILLSGFILFRIFDIIKPFGINAAQNLPGKFGILGDDLLAGVYALSCLELLKFLFVSFLK